MVSGTLCCSVVAMMKTTRGGGSSIVLSSALNELFESMWTSSMMKILYRSRAGENPMLPMITSRTFSTCVFEAASISCTSIERLSEISTQEGQAVGSSERQGCEVGFGDL